MHNINRKQNRCPETDDTDINHSTKKFHTREGWYTGGSGSGSGGGSGATRLSTYVCAHVTSVTEPKSYSSLPGNVALCGT